jgi:spermidine synthase
MPRPFVLLERVDTPEGPLELRQRDARDFMITIGPRVLMSSIIHRSEVLVAEWGCAPIRERPAPRVLIGGLGLGFTLRAALDTLPPRAQVVVAELNPAVERWCRGPLAALTGSAVGDPRVEVRVGDVTESIRRAASGPAAERFDAIVLDLYLGPADLPHGQKDPLYGDEILRSTAAALQPGGVYAVWSEEPNAAFERRLGRLGLAVEWRRNQGGGPRHAVYLGVKRAVYSGAPRAGSGGPSAGPARAARRTKGPRTR